MITTTQTKPSTLFDVLSGNESVKAEFGISTKSIVIACGIVLVTFIIGVYAFKNI